MEEELFFFNRRTSKTDIGHSGNSDLVEFVAFHRWSGVVFIAGVNMDGISKGSRWLRSGRSTLLTLGFHADEGALRRYCFWQTGCTAEGVLLAIGCRSL